MRPSAINCIRPSSPSSLIAARSFWCAFSLWRKPGAHASSMACVYYLIGSVGRLSKATCHQAALSGTEEGTTVPSHAVIGSLLVGCCSVRPLRRVRLCAKNSWFLISWSSFQKHQRLFLASEPTQANSNGQTRARPTHAVRHSSERISRDSSPCCAHSGRGFRSRVRPTNSPCPMGGRRGNTSHRSAGHWL